MLVQTQRCVSTISTSMYLISDVRANGQGIPKENNRKKNAQDVEHFLGSRNGSNV